jgi:hypothetical protein
MVNAQSPGRPTQVRARQIKPSDRDAVAALLRKGFGRRRTPAFWQQVLNRLERHRAPDGMPQYGYLLESDGRAVGAILAIFSIPRTGADPDAVRCSISSWYVETAFRSYASLLASQALKHRTATYLNISPAANTRHWKHKATRDTATGCSMMKAPCCCRPDKFPQYRSSRSSRSSPACCATIRIMAA